MNSVHIIGNITRDIELKYAQSGTAIASMGVAVNKKVKNQSGGYDDKPIFIDVTAFGKTAETLNQYFRKGSKIGIDGELNFEQWEDQQGQKRSKLSVIMNRLHFIDKKDDSQQPQQNQQQGGYNAPQQNQNNNQAPAQNNYNQNANAPQSQQNQSQHNNSGNSYQPNQNQSQPQNMNYGQQQQQQYGNQQNQNNNNNNNNTVNEDDIPF